MVKKFFPNYIDDDVIKITLELNQVLGSHVRGSEVIGYNLPTSNYDSLVGNLVVDPLAGAVAIGGPQILLDEIVRAYNRLNDKEMGRRQFFRTVKSGVIIGAGFGLITGGFVFPSIKHDAFVYARENANYVQAKIPEAYRI